MLVAVAVARTVHSLRSTICLLTQISSTRADFIPPISSLQLQRTYSSYTAKLHRYSWCLPFILCTNHEFPMESARLKLMLSYEQYTLKLEELLIQSLHYCLAPSATSFSQHQLPSIPDYNFTLLEGIAFLDHVRFLSIISARVELMRSVLSPHAQHIAPVGGSARLELMQAPHIIHCYRCVFLASDLYPLTSVGPSLPPRHVSLLHRASGRLDLLSAVLPPRPSFLHFYVLFTSTVPTMHIMIYSGQFPQ